MRKTMHNKKLLANYGLKWNPFIHTPVEGLISTNEIDNFCWRVENLVMDGGFAMITGSVGSGKSTALRLLNQRLSGLSEVQVVQIDRPQSGLADFYRELGDKFGQQFAVTNRYNCFKQLREKWKSHIESTLFRPIVLIDEAQEMQSFVLSELRLMSSTQLDSRPIITIILCGDERLPEKFKSVSLLPLGSRIRTRLVQEPKGRDDLSQIVTEAVRKAGNPNLLSKGLIGALTDHSIGNLRTMMNMAAELLEEGLKREVSQLDEKLFIEIYSPTGKPNQSTRRRK
jgi:general secretion pathway protein A